MSGPPTGLGTGEVGSPERLESWKAIAAYFRRDVTTIQRWERREGMPVHRQLHDKRGSVYALVAELDSWRERRSALAEVPPVPARAAVEAPQTGSADGAGNARRPQGGGRSRRSLFVAASILVGLAIATLLAAPHLWRRDRPAEALPSGITALAVLPLRNLSGDPAQEYLADGMTEELIGRLALIHGLRVVSRTSVMSLKNTELTAPQIGKRLAVDAIVEGSVARVGDRIRVTAQLIHAATDEHIWSSSYDRRFENALSLESELAQSIAEKVEVTLTGKERERLAAARNVAPEVYEAYLKGRFVYNSSQSRSEILGSIPYFESAIRLDPTFAPAYVGLARAYTTLGLVTVGSRPAEVRPQVMSAAQKALALDPSLVEAHVMLANIEQQEWRWADAQAEYQRALDLNPNDGEANAGFALWLLCQGRTDEAVTWVRRGRALDPVTVTGDSVAWILFQSHRYQEAIRELHSMLALQPDDTSALTTLGFVLSANGNAAQAIKVLEKAVALSGGSPAATGVLIRSYALAGRRGDALRLLSDLKRRRAAGYVPAAAFVNAYLGLRDREAAFAWLEQAYAEQSNILQFLKVHPYFDAIRGDPRFADLVRRVWRDSSQPLPRP